MSGGDLKEFTVVRSRWFRGKGSNDSRLRTKDGCQCCLGFLGEACGVPDRELNEKLLPRPAETGGSENWPTWLFADRGDWEPRALLANFNDDEEISDRERERLIAQECTRHGVSVRFVDEESGHV